MRIERTIGQLAMSGAAFPAEDARKVARGQGFLPAPTYFDEISIYLRAAATVLATICRSAVPHFLPSRD